MRGWRSCSMRRTRSSAAAMLRLQTSGGFGMAHRPLLRDSRWDSSAVPLYTLLKAATAIARAREATEAGFDTVPVFWLASEDHDFAEIAQVNLPSKRRSEARDHRPGAGASSSGGRHCFRDRASRPRWLTWKRFWGRAMPRCCCARAIVPRRRWQGPSESSSRDCLRPGG